MAAVACGIDWAQNVADVIMVVDEHGLIRYVSPSIERQLGCRAVMCSPALDTAIEARDQARPLSCGSLLTEPDRTWHEVVARNMLHDPDIKGVVINQRATDERRLEHDDLA